MIKKFALLLALSLLLFTGCKDYRGLSELSIVAGITIDMSKEEADQLHLTFEIVDTTAGPDEKGKKTLIMEADGLTVLEAVANANEQLARDMYFGNAELVVVHEKVAREVGLDPIIEAFIREQTTRDTLLMVVSKEETAQKILAKSPEEGKIVSYDITAGLDWQKRNANSTRALELYEIYDDMKRNTDCLSLPAYRIGKEGDKEQPMLDGLAVFQGDKLQGYLDSELVPNFMYLIEPLNQGTFAFAFDEDPKKAVTLLIQESKPKLSFQQRKENLSLTADVKIRASISNLSPNIGDLDAKLLREIEKQAGEQLKKRVDKTIATMQKETETDIFGFGKNIYRQNLAYWNTIKDDWTTLFPKATPETNVQFQIDKTGMLASY